MFQLIDNLEQQVYQAVPRGLPLCIRKKLWGEGGEIDFMFMEIKWAMHDKLER